MLCITFNCCGVYNNDRCGGVIGVRRFAMVGWGVLWIGERVMCWWVGRCWWWWKKTVGRLRWWPDMGIGVVGLGWWFCGDAGGGETKLGVLVVVCGVVQRGLGRRHGESTSR